MKKVLFLIVTLVCAVTGAWADTSVSLSDGTLTIRTTDAGTLSGWTFTPEQKGATSLVLIGKFNAADLQKIQTSGNDFKFTSVDMSQAILVDTRDPNNTSRPEGAVSGYEWFKTEATGGSSTKAIVGGNLFQAETITEKKWTPEGAQWDATIYADNAALEAAKEYAPVGSHAKIPQNPSYKYYKRGQYNWEGPNDNAPSDVTVEIGNFDENNVQSYFNTYAEGQWVRVYARNLSYSGWVLTEEVKSRSWGEVTDKDNVSLSYVYSSIANRDANTTATNGQYAVVGGEEYIYDGSAWVKASEATSTVNWKLIKFKYWKDALTEAILPPNVVASDLEKPWEQVSKQGPLTVVSGGASAVINNNKASLTAPSAEEIERLKRILAIEFLDYNNDFPSETIEDDNYIRQIGETNVYEVYVNKAGRLKQIYESEKPFPASAIFRFRSDSQNFTAEDLQALAPNNGPYYYVDLYDMTATPAIETAIEDAINGIISKNSNAYYYKGLLLPKDPDRIGTALILNSKNSPVSEFIAYNSGSTTVAHIYDTQPTNSEPYTTKVTNLNTILNGQPEIATNTSVYLVSTNSKKAISNVTSISETATIVHTYNNEMVNANTSPTEPTILVIPAEPDDYATLNSATNIRNTPNTEVLKFSGAISEADILAVNSFTQAHWDNATNSYVENDNPKKYNGPKVLDLSAVTSEITQVLLNKLNNPEIEHIILPAGMDAPVVGDYAYLENLKCVISTDVKSKEGDKVLTAYVREPGSLDEARTYATGEISSNNKVGLNKIKLYGNLRTEDIAKDNYGALYAESSIESLDLADAVFVKIDAATSKPVVDGAGGYVVDEDCSQMDFSTHKNSNLSQIFLPTDPRMKTIPQNCFEQVDKLSEVCIPINYTRILSGAFTQTDVCHITTTDSNGNLVDMGENTYVLPENLTFIGTHSFDTKSKTVTDVYVQSTIPPVCEKDAFSTEMTWGDGGADFDATNTNGVYCRDVFNNGGNAVAILHFPAQEGSGLSNAEYKAMAEKYTDITKVYTKKDQTGAVDANGNPITWPIESEFKRSYHQAENGVIWMDEGWVNSDGTIMQNSNPYTVIEEGSTNKLETCGFKDYVGWHQFVLCFASFMPTEDSDVREYVKDGWHTFCIPYDMTLKDVVELMGVPKSDGKIVNKIVDGENVTLVEDDDILPDIYTLEHVERQLITKTNQGNIHLALSESLVHEVGGKKMGRFPSYKDNANNVLRNGRENKGEVQVYEDNGYINGEPVILRAGYPYLIKPYIRNGESRPYLGQYVMTHHEFPQENSAIMMVDGEGESAVKTTRHHNHCWIDLIQSTDMTDPVKRVTSYDGDVMAALKGTEKDDDKRDKWSRFAIPYEGHRFKATILNENTGAVDGYDNDMVYSFHGNYWKQPLPLNCYYLNTKKATHKWYYYKNYSAAYVWHPYTCILGVGLDVKKDESTSDNLIDAYGSSNILNPIKWDANGNPVYKRKFQLGYTDEQDDSFEGMSHAREIRIVFDDAITEIGEDGEVVTAIETLDGKKLAPISGKVFNLRGQYVGDSVDGLPKGLYIVNGHKVVVD